MKQYKKISKQQIVSGLIFCFLFIFVQNSDLYSSNTSKEISAKKAYELILKNGNSNDLIILDIRTKEEFSQGHIKGALHIDYFAPYFKKKLSELDKDKTYLFHCKSGGRSGRTVRILKELHFNKTIHMNGGFDEWLKFKLPVAN